MDGLKVGDTIKCFDEKDLINTHNELSKSGIQTDFVYEINGIKGFFLEVLKVGE